MNDGFQPLAYDQESLRAAVLAKNVKLRIDAPQGERRTSNTFAGNYDVLSWAQRGDLAQAVRNFNAGGTFNHTSGEFLPTDFWLQRIFDAMEALGQKMFEKFIPNIWDSVLAIYRMRFSVKIEQAQKLAQAPAPEVNPDTMYDAGPGGE